MPWIESHTVLLRHRKVLLMACALGLQPVVIVGHLHALWHAVLEQAEDGDLSSWPDEMIAQAAAFIGDATAFVRALQAQKFLDGKVVHDWLDYAGRYLANKYRTSNPKKLKAIYKLHQSASKSDFSQTKVRLKPDNLTKPDLTKPDRTRPDQTKPTKPKNIPSAERLPLANGASGVETWDRYSEAYQERYGVDPVRNATINSILKKLVDRLGADEAPRVAGFYLSHNSPFYVAKRHPVNLLLADAEGLRTQWATGIKATSREAKNAEFKDNLVGQVDRVNRMIEDRKAANGVEGEVGQ